MNLRFAFILWLAVPVLLAAAEDFSPQQRILPLTPPTLSKEAIARPEEEAKIHREFLAQDPWIKVFARFPFFYSTIYLEDRKTTRVRFDICSVIDEKYVVCAFLSMRLDSSLSKVLEHKVTIEAQYFSSLNFTNVDQVGPLTRISEKDLEKFCEAPVEYLRKNVPKAKKG